MKKFSDLYKEKMNEAEVRQENKVLNDFKKIYSAMLEHHGLTSVKELNEESQLSFLTELNYYWTEETGLTERGDRFLAKRSISLNENSTLIEKKNFLRTKVASVVNETLRQTNLKHKLYTIIDEMYVQTKAKNLNEVLSTPTISNIFQEVLSESFTKFVEDIEHELKESVEPKRKYIIRVKK